MLIKQIGINNRLKIDVLYFNRYILKYYILYNIFLLFYYKKFICWFFKYNNRKNIDRN